MSTVNVCYSSLYLHTLCVQYFGRELTYGRTLMNANSTEYYKVHSTEYCNVPYSTQYSTQYRIGLCSVLRQHSIGYMGDGFYRSKDPTNSIKVLKEDLQKTKQTMKTTKYTYVQTIIKTQKDIHKISTTSPLVYTNMG